jgi:solute carrier family 10 (sodium/bile acid cotransporter), member 7
MSVPSQLTSESEQFYQTASEGYRTAHSDNEIRRARSVARSSISSKSSGSLTTSIPAEEPVSPKRKWYAKLPKGVVWYLEDQWFLIALAFLIVIASQVQSPKPHQQIKETVVTYTCVSVIFLVTGLTLPTRTLLRNYSRWKLHLFVQIQCFLMTSAIVFGTVSAVATNKSFMDPGLLVGLILTGSVATTISSNVVMTRQACGNQVLTVVQSTVGNFLGPFLTPVLVKMYTSTGAWYTEELPSESGAYGEIYRRVFKQLGLSIFLPIVGTEQSSSSLTLTPIRSLVK